MAAYERILSGVLLLGLYLSGHVLIARSLTRSPRHCRPMRSPHYITRTEALRGAANRVLFSQFYILLYLGMALLSCVPSTTSSLLPVRRTDSLSGGTMPDRLATVILSATSGCPTLTFYILEVIVNSSMILEVGIRLLAFGKVRRPGPPVLRVLFSRQC